MRRPLGSISPHGDIEVFCRKCGVPFSWEEYLHQTEHQSTFVSNTQAQPTDANHVEEGAISTYLDANPSEKEMSFAQITTLIESGQTDLIPNTESIPGGVNVCQTHTKYISDQRLRQ